MTPSKWYVLVFFREINFSFLVFISPSNCHIILFQANIADLYFKNSLNTRLSLVYVETWQDADQTPGFSRQRYDDIFLNSMICLLGIFTSFFLLFFRNIAEAMRTFSDYTGRKLYSVDKDTTQLLT